jgi:L-asparaginase
VRVASQSIAQKESLELTDEDRDLLLRSVDAEPCRRIIITHGTDTIPLSANSRIFPVCAR